MKAILAQAMADPEHCADDIKRVYHAGYP